MRLKSPGKFAALLFAAFLYQPVADATTVLQMTLNDLTTRADRVFRGGVLSMEPGTVEVGGGSLPAVTYELVVEERFKGDYPSDEEKTVVTVTMIGNAKQADVVVDGQRRLTTLPEVPELEVGEEYVLFTTEPSSAGLSTTVGLGQGAFKIFLSPDREELAANEINNAGLFDGPVAYATLADAIRAELGN